MDELFKAMGKRIQIRRKELHMKQSDLAERIDVSNNHISGIETGAHTPSLPTFIRICEELNVTPDYIILGSMRTNNAPQNIIDTIRLCEDRDVELIQAFASLLAERNNNNHID